MNKAERALADIVDSEGEIGDEALRDRRDVLFRGGKVLVGAAAAAVGSKLIEHEVTDGRYQQLKSDIEAKLEAGKGVATADKNVADSIIQNLAALSEQSGEIKEMILNMQAENKAEAAGNSINDLLNNMDAFLSMASSLNTARLEGNTEEAIRLLEGIDDRIVSVDQKVEALLGDTDLAIQLLKEGKISLEELQRLTAMTMSEVARLRELAEEHGGELVGNRDLNQKQTDDLETVQARLTQLETLHVALDAELKRNSILNEGQSLKLEKHTMELQQLNEALEGLGSAIADLKDQMNLIEARDNEQFAALSGRIDGLEAKMDQVIVLLQRAVAQKD